MDLVLTSPEDAMADCWVAWYWSDYLAKTTGLTPQEHGIYVMLLANYYVQGGPLPNDRKRLERMCSVRSRSEKRSLDTILGQFFALDGATFRNKRADEEIAKRLEISQKRREAVNTRYTNVPTFVEQLNTQPQPQPQKDKNNGAEKRAVELPPWLPEKEWNEYLKMRARIRRPATDFAIEILIRKLERFRKEGHDPTVVLRQSIENAWQGLFEPRQSGNKPAHRPRTTGSATENMMEMRRRHLEEMAQNG
jgi:uncharacterized protein YdaU (DUF1376 family)